MHTYTLNFLLLFKWLIQFDSKYFLLLITKKGNTASSKHTEFRKISTLKSKVKKSMWYETRYSVYQQQKKHPRLTFPSLRVEGLKALHCIIKFNATFFFFFPAFGISTNSRHPKNSGFFYILINTVSSLLFFPHLTSGSLPFH